MQKSQKDVRESQPNRRNTTKSADETILEETKRIIETKILNIEALWLRLKVAEQRIDSIDARVENFSRRISQLTFKNKTNNAQELRKTNVISDVIGAAEEVMRERQKLSDQKPLVQQQAQQTTT